MDLKDHKEDLQGFKVEVWSGFDGRPVYEWNSQFSNYRVQTSKKGYNVIGRDSNDTTVCLMYFDIFEEAVYYIRHKEITKFFDDEY